MPFRKDHLQLVTDAGATLDIGWDYGTPYSLDPINGVDVDVQTAQGVNQVGVSVERQSVAGVSRELIIHCHSRHGDKDAALLLEKLPYFTSGTMYFEDKYFCRFVLSKTPYTKSIHPYPVLDFMLFCPKPFWYDLTAQSFCINGFVPSFRLPVNYSTPHRFGVRTSIGWLNAYNPGALSVPFTATLKSDGEVVNPCVLNIVTGQITDTRLDESLCGVVRDGVTGIPTDELLAAARERINALEEKATTSAAAAKASEDNAALSEQSAAASEKNASDSETAAKQALQDTQDTRTAALTDISTARTTTLNDIATARTIALNDVAASTKTAETAATTATEQASAAAGSANEAAGSASEAENSKTAAATSETNAKASEEAAKSWAEEAKKAANTDTTVSIEGAPADAAATRALIKELLAQQREEDYAKIKFWASPEPTSPAAIIGGTWERIEGKMIMGASAAYPAGTTGGSATHTQTVAEMPSHNHSGSTGSAGSHSHSGSTGSAGSHSHTYTKTTWSISQTTASSSVGYASVFSNSDVSTSAAGSHTHTISINSAGAHTHTVSIGSTGSGQAMNILNPYLALYLWQRVG